MFFNRNEPHELPAHDSTERRLQRIESRLVRLMQHLGLDPYEKVPQQYRQELARRGDQYERP
jgi:hypothetical protein